MTLAAPLAIYALAVRGLRRAPREAGTAALLLTMVYLAVVSAAPNAMDDRYRLPILALLAVFAGGGWGRAEPSAQREPEPCVLAAGSSDP